ncbi:MAG: RNA polymerase sigma factor [bacterium]|nr:RNA polymerase sigma factor [bacterium]
MDPQLGNHGAARPDHEDMDLVNRSNAGDRAAFESIYRRYVDRIYGTSLRLTADRVEAEGLTQDTFVRAWFSLAGYSGQGSLGGWLARVAVNLWRDRFRSDKRRDRLQGQLTAELAAGPALPVDPRDRGGVIPLLTALDLEWAVAQLPPGARTVFVLHDVEGFKHREIGEMLGLATGTVKAHLHRARRLLRGMLADEREETHGS